MSKNLMESHHHEVHEMSEVNMNSNSIQTQVFIMIIVKDMLS